MAEPRQVQSVAVAGTGTYKSLVGLSEDRYTTYQWGISGTVTGTFSVEVNSRPEKDYQADVLAAGSEDLNTTGWVTHDLRAGGMNPHHTTATLAVTNTTNTFIYLPPGAYRTRLSWTNATGSGTVTAYRRHIKM